MRLKICIFGILVLVFAPASFGVAAVGLVEAMRFYHIIVPRQFFVPYALALSVLPLISVILPFVALALPLLSRKTA